MVHAGAFDKVEHVLLVGVAGGVACPEDDTYHVRLGDVIMSQPVKAGDCIYIQLPPDNLTGSIENVKAWTPHSNVLASVIGKLQKTPKSFYKRFDQFLKEGWNLVFSSSGNLKLTFLSKIKHLRAKFRSLWTLPISFSFLCGWGMWKANS